MRTSSFTDDEIRRATDMYFEGGVSHADVCKTLGYPSQATLSRWTRADPRYLAHRMAQAAASACGGGGAAKPRKSYPYEVRLEAVRLAEEEHLTRREVAERLGICAPAMVSKWVTRARKHGREALMPKNGRRGGKATPDRWPTVAAAPDTTDVEELLRQNAQLRMDNAILEETIKALKKRPRRRPE